MLALLVIIVVTLVVLAIQRLQAPRKFPTSADPGPAAMLSESLALRLPEPMRGQVWQLLCTLQDANEHAPRDAQTAYLLRQAQQSYLPETLQAYLSLTPAARERLKQQGQTPEHLLQEQLSLIERGVQQTLKRDYSSADRLLTQGKFLRERFAAGELELER